MYVPNIYTISVVVLFSFTQYSMILVYEAISLSFQVLCSHCDGKDYDIIIIHLVPKLNMGFQIGPNLMHIKD